MIFDRRSVKHKTFSAAAVLICGIVFSACERVSEEPLNGGIQTANTVVLTEETTQTAGITSEATSKTQTETETENSDVESDKTLQEETKAVSETTNAEDSAARETDATTSRKKKKQTETTETEPEVIAEPASNTIVYEEESVTTTTTTTAKTEDTTLLTLQSESPAETAAYDFSGYKALNYREQMGIWISYLEYSSVMKNKSESQFRTAIGEYFDNVKALSFNTVYVQVRAFGDAYYRSDIFPTGDCYNGTIGAKLAYDPLQIMIDEAHDRELSLHAWINPMRLMTDSQLKSLSDSYVIKQWYDDSRKCGKYIVKSGDRWYLNPAYSAVGELISDGIAEVVSEYDVDGIQIDDYFYPTTAGSFDKSAYTESGTQKSLSSWRTENINDMVRRINRTVHKVNPTVLFGISPQGSVDNNYNELYADVKTWCRSSDYCDYILPQVYFGFKNSALPYEDTISLWSDMTSSGNVKLVIGLAGYKVGASDKYAGAKGKNEWIENSDMLAKQIAAARRLKNFGGAAIFRYGSLFDPDSSVAKQVSAEIANISK